MEYSTELSDYKDNPQDLIGKPVLISGRYHSSIKNIVKVTKTAFKVDGSDTLYSLLSGYKKSSDTWSIEHTKIITPKEAMNLKKEWKMKSESDSMRTKLEKILPSLTHDTPTKIIELITNPH